MLEKLIEFLRRLLGTKHLRNDDVDLITGEIRKLRQAILNQNQVLSYLLTGQEIMSKAMDDMTAATAKITSAVDAATSAFKDLASQIVRDKEDPDAIEALANTLNANADRLAAAIVVGTPASTPEAVAVVAAPAPPDDSAPATPAPPTDG